MTCLEPQTGSCGLIAWETSVLPSLSGLTSSFLKSANWYWPGREGKIVLSHLFFDPSEGRLGLPITNF